MSVLGCGCRNQDVVGKDREACIVGTTAGGGCAEQPANSLIADMGAEAVLVRHTGCQKVRREVLRQHPPHAAVWLAQSNKASDPETLKYDGRNGGGKPEAP